jgi:hypothetical protein
MVVGRGKTYLERVAEERKPTPTPGWEARLRAEFGRDPEPAA